MTLIAPTLQAFFTDRLTQQLHASPRTIASYRDSLRLLLRFANDRTGIVPSALDWDDLDEPLIAAFLEHLETDRHNSARTRNLRLTAIRALFRYAALRHPEHAAVIARVLSIPRQAVRPPDRDLPHRRGIRRADRCGAREPLGGTTRPRDAHARAARRPPGLRADRDQLRRHRARDRSARPRRRQRPQAKSGPAHQRRPGVLAVWLDERAGLSDDPLFPTRTGRRLTRDAVERRVATHVATAAQRCSSLAGKRVHPHVLRHSCAMSLLQARVDSTVIALWLGHADTGSTQQYIHADMTIKERARAPDPTHRDARPLQTHG
jgi:site-specific recombinase XerD